jgi:hypothetical protein
MTAREKFAIYGPGILGAAGLALGLADAAGVLGKSWLTNHPGVMLSVLSLLLGFTSVMEKTANDTKARVEDLVIHQGKADLERLRSVTSRLDPSLQRVFSEHVEGLLAKLLQALENRTVKVDGLDFGYFYRKSLEGNPGCHFMATALPYKRYFWKSQPALDAIAKFIANRGTMTRIFFLESEEELCNDEVIEVLSSQARIGVEVYTLCEVPPRLQKYFMVAKDRSIAWETFIGTGQELVSATVTSQPDRTLEYLRDFDQLMNLPVTKRFDGAQLVPRRR